MYCEFRSTGTRAPGDHGHVDRHDADAIDARAWGFVMWRPGSATFLEGESMALSTPAFVACSDHRDVLRHE